VMGTEFMVSGRHRFAHVLGLFAATTPHRRAGSGGLMDSANAAARSSRIKRCAFAVAFAHILAAPALADPIESPACRIELATTWANIKEMVTRLKAVSRSGPDEKCAVYRTHVQVVVHAREVLSRCRSGREREADLAQMDGALEDVNGALGRECGGTARVNPDSSATWPSQ